ncbi:hypothetical protein, partial [Microcoleus sp. herbarium5]|uniref:hypothetical protein n=1 Tax=Microcoleus sp. herbarium5 TaxID=3055434 RepID=UPI002FD1C7C4
LEIIVHHIASLGFGHSIRCKTVRSIETDTAFIISCYPTIRMKAAIEISSIFGTSANVTLTLTPLYL